VKLVVGLSVSRQSEACSNLQSCHRTSTALPLSYDTDTDQCMPASIRYRLSRTKQIVEEYFTASGDEEWSARCNIAPTQPVPVIR
jgi:hypothetical protein